MVIWTCVKQLSLRKHQTGNEAKALSSLQTAHVGPFMFVLPCVCAGPFCTHIRYSPTHYCYSGLWSSKSCRDVLWPNYLWSCSKASADQSRGFAGKILGNRMHQPPAGAKRFGTSWHTVRLVKSMSFWILNWEMLEIETRATCSCDHPCFDVSLDETDEKSSKTKQRFWIAVLHNFT